MAKRTNNPDKVYGQTINVRYYTEKKVKPRKYFHGGKEFVAYPLYVQINVKRQTLQRKSILGAYVPPELLDQYLQDHAQEVADETNALRDRILEQKPFDNANFSLKHTLNGYSVFQEDVCYLIGQFIRDEYKTAYETDLIERMKTDLSINLPEVEAGQIEVDDLDEQLAQLEQRAGDIFYRGKDDEMIHPILVFGEMFAHAVPDNKQVLALWTKYEKYFWSLENYCQVLRFQLKLTVLTLEFFLSPAFRQTFIDFWNVDTYNAVFEGFNKFREDHPEFNKLIKSRRA